MNTDINDIFSRIFIVNNKKRNTLINMERISARWRGLGKENLKRVLNILNHRNGTVLFQISD